MFAYMLASNPCSEATFLMLEALRELSLENFRLDAFCVLLSFIYSLYSSSSIVNLSLSPLVTVTFLFWSMKMPSAP